MVRIETEVVVADYDLLRKTFPCALAGRSEAEINEWLKREAGYFRNVHIEATPADADRPTIVWSEGKPRTKIARVPANYGRAAVVGVSQRGRCNDDPRLLDIKGTGTDSPEWEAYHRSGVLELNGALQEFFMEKWVAFLHTLPDRTRAIRGTNPSYAVLVIKNVSSPIPTLWEDDHGQVHNISEGWGILVRKYSQRARYYALEGPLQYSVEGWLRRHGLTGLISPLLLYYPGTLESMDYTTLPLVLDYQKSVDNHLVDFSPFGLYEAADVKAWHPGQPILSIQFVASLNASSTSGCFNVESETLLRKTAQECLTYLKFMQWQNPVFAKLTDKYFAQQQAVSNPLGLRKSVAFPLTLSQFFFLGTSWWKLWDDPSDQTACLNQLLHAFENHREWNPDFQSSFQNLFTLLLDKLHRVYKRCV